MTKGPPTRPVQPEARRPVGAHCVYRSPDARMDGVLRASCTDGSLVVLYHASALVILMIVSR